MKKNYQSILILVILLLLLFFYLWNTSLMMQEFLDYSLLFFTKLVPVSFFMLLLMSLLIQYGIANLFKSYSWTLFFLSLFSGFPSGAKYTVDFIKRKEISIEEGNQMLLFSHFPNPMFVLGTITLVLEDSTLSKKILFSIIVSNLILFVFSKKKKKNEKKEQKKETAFSKAINDAILTTAKTLLLIYGTSVFFYSFFVFLSTSISIPTNLYVLLGGILDLTKGVLITSILSNHLLRSYLILFFLTFGNLSIHIQVKSILADTSLSYRYFLIGRIIGTFLAGIIFSLLINVDLLQ